MGNLNSSALLDRFLDLAVEWPVAPEQFGLTSEVLVRHEMELLTTRIEELHSSRAAVRDLQNTPMALEKLCPFFLAVICEFALRCGIAPEFPFGFAYTMAGWLCHRDLHGRFDPLRPEHVVRPRIFSVPIGDSNSGNRFVLRQCVNTVHITTGGSVALVDSHQQCFADPGPKPLYVGTATQGDFAERMSRSGGRLFWASPEAWNVLDIGFAKSRGGRVQMDAGKVNYGYLLDTQNGWEYGPVSIKGQKEQYHVPTTNFGMFHLGQPKLIHDFWGQTFMEGCPFGGMGWETRPTFLWPANNGDEAETDVAVEVSFRGAANCLKAVFAAIVVVAGHNADRRQLVEHPVRCSEAAAQLWAEVSRGAKALKRDAPDCIKSAVGKHCFTTTSHVLAGHVLQQGFSFARQERRLGNFQSLLEGQQDYTQRHMAAGPGCPFPALPPGSLLCAAEHLHHMASSLAGIHREMQLPSKNRAGAALAEPVAQGSGAAQPARSPDEEALALLFQRTRGQQFLTTTDVNRILPRRFGFRSNVTAVTRLFNVAAQMNAGVVEQSPDARGRSAIRFRLTLDRVSPESRTVLGLTADAPVPLAPAANLPAMPGAGLPRSNKAAQGSSQLAILKRLMLSPLQPRRDRGLLMSPLSMPPPLPPPLLLLL